MDNLQSLSSDRIKQLFPESLINMRNRCVSSETNDQFTFLDKNELPYEIEGEIKQKIIEQLNNTSWNRYPSAFYPELEKQIADYAGVGTDNIVIGTGAAKLLEMLFNLFARKNLVIARPSFSLFELLSRAYGINYKNWELDQNREYTIDTLPEVREDSVVVFASPNNPTGTVVREELLHYLLGNYPNSLFIVDEVYSEFCNYTLERLIDQYSNLILVRSFSKAFGLAGARIGYLICSEQISEQLKKVTLPFVLNHFSEIALTTILKDSKILTDIKNKIRQVIQARDKMFYAIRNENDTKISVYESHANFLLVRFSEEERFKNALIALQNKNIKILDLSHITSLPYSMRISIGRPNENDMVLNCLLNS